METTRAANMSLIPLVEKASLDESLLFKYGVGTCLDSRQDGTVGNTVTLSPIEHLLLYELRFICLQAVVLGA